MRSNRGAPKWSGLGAANGLLVGSRPWSFIDGDERAGSDDDPRVAPRRGSDAARLTAIDGEELFADRDVHGDQPDDDEPDRDPRYDREDRHHAAGARVAAHVGDQREQGDEARARPESAESGELGEVLRHQPRLFCKNRNFSAVTLQRNSAESLEAVQFRAGGGDAM